MKVKSSSFFALLLLMAFGRAISFLAPSVPMRTPSVQVAAEGNEPTETPAGQLEETLKKLVEGQKLLVEGQELLRKDMRDRLTKVEDGQKELGDRLSHLEHTVNRIDQRTGLLVESEIRRKIQGEKKSITDAEDVVELLSPGSPAERNKWVDKINLHLYRYCTRSLLTKITGDDTKHKKGWEQFAFQALLKTLKDKSKELDSAERKVIREFQDLLKVGAPSKNWLKSNGSFAGKPIEGSNGNQLIFNHEAATRHLKNNPGLLVPSLMFSDPHLAKWDYRAENKWAMSEIDIDCASPRNEYGILVLVQIKSSAAGRNKAKDQLLFRAHLMDEYAYLVWQNDKEKQGEEKILSLKLKEYVLDSPASGVENKKIEIVSLNGH